MASKASKMRNSATFLEHLADEAERQMTKEQLVTERNERVARHMDEDPTDEEFLSLYAKDIEQWPLLPDSLRASAKVQRQTATTIEEAEEAEEVAALDYASTLEDAKRHDWYDPAYEGFCDGMAAAA